jgi:general stress protein YciG
MTPYYLTAMQLVKRIMWRRVSISGMLLMDMATRVPRKYFAELGRKGGKTSWEKLSPEQKAARARHMALARTSEERSERGRKAGRASAAARKAKADEATSQPHSTVEAE